jgi:hypothetical protein
MSRRQARSVPQGVRGRREGDRTPDVGCVTAITAVFGVQRQRPDPQRLQRPTIHQPRVRGRSTGRSPPACGSPLLRGRQGGPGDDPYLDITRRTHDTGFAPTSDVATAVAASVAWRREPSLNDRRVGWSGRGCRPATESGMVPRPLPLDAGGDAELILLRV